MGSNKWLPRWCVQSRESLEGRDDWTGGGRDVPLDTLVARPAAAIFVDNEACALHFITSEPDVLAVTSSKGERGSRKNMDAK